MLTVELVVLVITGVALYFVYRPRVGGGFDLSSLSSVMRAVHQVTAWLAAPTAAVLGVLVAFGSAAVRRWAALVLGVALAACVLAASLTGFLLPWDQLGLRAVQVGTNIDGFEVFFGDRVRFAIFDGAEVGTVTVIRWLIIHTVVLGPLALVLTVVARRRHRGTRAAEASPDAAETSG